MGAYDRWELKLNKKTTKQTASIVKEWADAVLFANYKTIVMTTKEGKKKAQGGQQRVLYTEHAATWDAKNRWGLPMEVPFEYASIAAHIPDASQETPQAPAPVEEKPSLATVLGYMKKDKITEKEVCKAISMAGYYPAEMPLADYSEAFIANTLVKKWESIAQYIFEHVRKGETK